MNNVAQHEEKDAVLSSIFISVIALYWYECGHREKRREGKGLFRIM
jgi:hypothetical protein